MKEERRKHPTKKYEKNRPCMDSVQRSALTQRCPDETENLAFSQEKIKISLGIRIGLKNCLAS